VPRPVEQSLKGIPMRDWRCAETRTFTRSTWPLLLLATLIASPIAASCGSPGGGGPTLADDTQSTTDTAGDTAILDADPPPDDTSSLIADSVGVDTILAEETSSGPTDVGVGVILGEIASPFLNTAFAAARFTRVVPPPDTSGEVHGPCRVTHVDPNAPEPGRFGLDAGLVTISGTQPTVTLSPTAEGAFGTGYTSSLPQDQAQLLPGGGAILTIAGAGGADIAAFSGALQIPEPVTIGSPATGLSATANPQVPLPVSWNAGIAHEVVISLSPLDAFGNPRAGPAAFCTVTGDPGALTVPSSALVAVVDGPGSVRVAFGVTKVRTSRAETAAHRVPFTVTRSNGGPLELRVP